MVNVCKYVLNNVEFIQLCRAVIEKQSKNELSSCETEFVKVKSDNMDLNNDIWNISWRTYG